MMRQAAMLTVILFGFSIAAISQQDTPDEGDVVVAMPSNDEFYIGKDRVERPGVVKAVKALLDNVPPERGAVYIKPMCSVHHGAVVSLINDLQEAGIDKIGLLTVKGVSGQRPPEPAPTMEPAAEPTGSDPVIIELAGRDLVKVDSRTVAMSRLQATLRTLLGKRTDKTVFVAAPSKTQYCDIVKIVDIAKAASAMPIGFRIL